MKYLDYITGVMNEAILDGLPCENAQILGVASLVRTTKGGKQVTWPATYTGKGEQEFAGIDDKYDVCSYHRALNMSVGAATGATYGDVKTNVRLQHRMSLVIYAHRDKLKMSADQLALMLHFWLPESLTKDERPQDFYSVNINVSDVVLNEEAVFNEEFKNVDFFLGPEHVLLKCNYVIESVLNKRCFNTKCVADAAA